MAYIKPKDTRVKTIQLYKGLSNRIPGLKKQDPSITVMASKGVEKNIKKFKKYISNKYKVEEEAGYTCYIEVNLNHEQKNDVNIFLLVTFSSNGLATFSLVDFGSENQNKAKFIINDTLKKLEYSKEEKDSDDISYEKVLLWDDACNVLFELLRVLGKNKARFIE